MSSDQTLVLPVTKIEISYLQIDWKEFKRFIKRVYGLPALKFEWHIEDDLRDDAAFVINKQEIVTPWLEMLKKFKATGDTLDVDDAIHLILTDLCLTGFIQPGEYRFSDVW